MSGRPPSQDVEALLSHAGWLNRLALHLVRDEALAEDVAQEVWLAAQRSPPASDRPPRPWLAEVLRNAIRMRARSEGRRTRLERATLEETAIPSPEAVQERLELHRLLVESVTALDEGLRATVLLHFFEGKTSAEIARRLGVPAGTVRWRLKTAVDRLRAEMDRRCKGGRRAWAAAFAAGAGGVGGAGGAGGAKTEWALGDAGARAWAMMKSQSLWMGGAVIALALAGAAIWLAARPTNPGAEAGPALARANEPLELNPPPAARSPVADRIGVVAGSVVTPAGAVVAHASVALVPVVSALLREGPVVPAATTRGDANGRFTFDDIPPGEYTATATAPGWAPGHAAVVVERSSEGGSLAIMMGTGALTLAGRVLDAGGGAIPNARVTAVLTSQGQRRTANAIVVRAMTDDLGRYVLHTTGGGNALRVEADGYAPVDAWMDLTTNRIRDFELSPGAQLAGHVRVHGGGPVAGAEVVVASSEERAPRLELAPARTDESGRFVFAALPAGAYFVAARQGRLVSAPRDVTIAATERSEVDLVVDNGHSVGGHVRDHEGRAVAGAVVTVSLPPHFLAGLTYKKTVSNQDGSYLVEGVLPGVLKLSAKREAFMSLNDHAITLTDHDLRGVDLAVERPAIIEGQIVGADSRAANVEVSGRALDARWNRQMVVGLKATPDAEGRFQLVVMPARVTLTAVDRAHNTRAAIDLGPLVAGETRKILLRLTAPGVGRVAGKVLDADGRPRADTAVSIHRNDFQATTRTDGKGQFVIERLDAGAYYLFAQHDEDNGHLLAWNSAQVDVKLAAGETRSDLVLKLPPVAELVGVVLDPRGQPFVGATVLANPEERGRLLAGPSRRTTSDETGRFRLVNLPPMPHRVTAMHGAHPAVVVRAVMPGRAEIALRFAPAVHLSGVVIEEGGRPVSDYLLRVIGPAGDESRSIHDPDGRFHWLPSAVGAYTVSAFTASGQWGAADVKIAAGEAGTHVKVTVAPPADVRLRIIDAATGSAIEGADVRVSTEMSVQTKASDREGNVTCDGLPRTGFVDVQIEAAGYQPRGKRLDLPPKSQTDPVIIELKRQSGSRPAVDQRAD